MSASVDKALISEFTAFLETKYRTLRVENEQLKLELQDERAQSGRRIQQDFSKELSKLTSLVTTLQSENSRGQRANSQMLETLVAARAENESLKQRTVLLVSEKNDISTRLTQVEKDFREARERWKRNETVLRDNLLASEREHRLTATRLADAEVEREASTRRIDDFYSQVFALAREAENNRTVEIRRLFPPASFVDRSFESVMFTFEGDKPLSELLPKGTTSFPLYTLPSPPNSLPLRVAGIAQGGYWFSPASPHPSDVEFELVIEIKDQEWQYLGRYRTEPISGNPMRLSEWMSLDEMTKSAHCARTLSQGRPCSYAEQVGIRMKYDSGEFVVPCYILQCVGFDHTLHQALRGLSNKPVIGERT